MKRTRVGLSIAVVFLALVTQQSSVGLNSDPAYGRPLTYDRFISVREFPNLKDAILSGHRHLYVPPDVYLVDNPVRIDRDTALFLHGGDRLRTRLQAMDDTQPLFIVEAGTLISFAGLELWPAFLTPGSSTRINARAIVFENTSPVQFEMQDCVVAHSVMEIQGPGSFRAQGVVWAPYGYVESPIIVDHPLADLLVVGGNINNQSGGAQPGLTDIHHAWQKQGRFRIYGTGTQLALGRADFRIETGAVQGPHVIANVRSEGTNNVIPLPSAHLYVPPPADPNEEVDVLMMSNGLSAFPDLGAAFFVEYHAAGTVWLVGNNSDRGVGQLAIGNAPNATIVALGNHMYDNVDILPIDAGTEIFAGNVFFHALLTGDPTEPSYRFINPDLTLDDYPSIPPIPEVTIPLPLDRPVMNRPLPEMVVVSDYYDTPECLGSADDTCALQAAFDAALEGNGTVYIPEGTYHTSEPLYWLHSAQGEPFLDAIYPPPGGWIAGAGSGRTRIVRDPADKGSVLETGGMAYIAVQGITFETVPFDPDDPEAIAVANVDIENDPNVIHASQENIFYDCRFIGGKFTIGFGLTTGTNCSENMMVNCEFAEGEYGLGVGSYNALANIVYGGTFRDNRITMGQPRAPFNSGGTWAVLHATVTGTTWKEFEYFNSASGIWYFYNLQSDSNIYFFRDIGSTGAVFPMLFDHSRLSPAAPVSVPDHAFAMNNGGGPLFLYSELDPLNPGTLRHGGGISSNFGFKMFSNIPEWDSADVGPQHRTYEWLGDACPEVRDCGGANCAEVVPPDCTDTPTGLHTCELDPDATFLCPAGETLELRNCACEEIGPGPSCETESQTWSCSCDGEPTCDDGLFCNGGESCDPLYGCQAGHPPCALHETCDETTDACGVCEVPGETAGLVFHDPVTLGWDVVTLPGGTVLYDTLRTDDPTDFFRDVTCVESNDGSDLVATDVEQPEPGEVYFYLVRAQGDCALGEGPLGGSALLERDGAICPLD